MSYRLKEVQVSLTGGAIVTAEVTSVAGLKQLLADLDDVGIEMPAQRTKSENAGEKGAHHTPDTPEALVETRASLPPGSLLSKKLLAFKDGVPQFLRPNVFGSVADASVALLFAVEAGLKKKSLEFEAFKGLYESQNIKSGSPVSMLLTNLRNAQYVDSKLYSSERKVSLTAKGESKAIEVLKTLVEKAK